MLQKLMKCFLCFWQCYGITVGANGLSEGYAIALHQHRTVLCIVCIILFLTMFVFDEVRAGWEVFNCMYINVG